MRFQKYWPLFLAIAALFVGLVYIAPPLLIRSAVLSRGDAFLMTQPEMYRDEFFTYLPRDREVFDGHFPPTGPYADDWKRSLMNPLPPALYSTFLLIFGGNVDNAYIAMQFVFSIGIFLLLYLLRWVMTRSRLW